jgi:hypothetical protein
MDSFIEGNCIILGRRETGKKTLAKQIITCQLNSGKLLPENIYVISPFRTKSHIQYSDKFKIIRNIENIHFLEKDNQQKYIIVEDGSIYTEKRKIATFFEKVKDKPSITIIWIMNYPTGLTPEQRDLFPTVAVFHEEDKHIQKQLFDKFIFQEFYAAFIFFQIDLIKLPKYKCIIGNILQRNIFEFIVVDENIISQSDNDKIFECVVDKNIISEPDNDKIQTKKYNLREAFLKENDLNPYEHESVEEYAQRLKEFLSLKEKEKNV